MPKARSLHRSRHRSGYDPAALERLARVLALHRTDGLSGVGEPREPPLSPGELDVLEDAANCLTISETAASRFRCADAINVRKLGARCVTQAVAIAVSRRLVDPSRRRAA